MASAPSREFFVTKRVSEALAGFAPGRRTPVMRVPVNDALGRALADDVVSPEALPGFDRAAVDGYAVIAADTFGACDGVPTYLQVTGSVAMGTRAQARVSSGSAVAMATGAMLAPGADAVVMVEHTAQVLDGTIEVVSPVAPGEGVVRRGEDVDAGGILARRGAALRAQDLAALAAAGVVEVAVHARPRVAILATGDEVVSPDTAVLSPGQIRDALSVSVAALAGDAGGEPRAAGIVPDDPGALEAALAAVLAESDVVVICAGSSVGLRDQTAGAVAALPKAAIYCHGLAIKPGKPTLLAHAAEVPIIGLPGNPRSALVVFTLVGMPVIRRAGGFLGSLRRGSIRATLGRNLPSAAGRLDVVQVRLAEDVAEPLFGPSALLSVLTGADGYLIVPEAATGLAAGQEVEVFPYG